MIFDGDTFERDGVTFRVKLESDDDSTPPWKREDGHGDVSEWTTRDKRAGERVLCSDRSSKRYYDFAGAVAIAKCDGWDAPPYSGTKGERAARAAEADYERLRRWCADVWQYIGVVVEMLDDYGNVIDSDSLWGIESDSGDYLEQVANEIATEMLSKTANEESERSFWAARGVETRA